MRLSVSRVLGLLVVAALVAGAFAGTAAARTHYTKAQKAHIRAQLTKAIKKNPKLIKSAAFVKKASLVSYTLPIRVRIRQATDNAGGFTSNGSDNTATLDLGPSLGVREIGLGGTLPASIKFHDAFDGGGLGNVDLNLEEGGAGLTTTSIPLLANHSTTTAPPGGGGGCLGYPYNPAGSGGDVDNWANLTASNDPGVNNLGAGPSYGGDTGSVAQDTVLRTNSLTLKIDHAGTNVTAATLGLAAGTIPSFAVGESGGQANLFGNIPGKSTQIDVTANLVTNINSILREVDGATPPAAGGNAAANFDCRQAWSGVVENHLGGIHLDGTLKISPAITGDGQLRIAKATLSSTDAAPVAVAACLTPQAPYATETGVPSPPLNPTLATPAPTDACNTVRSDLLETNLGFTGIPGAANNGDRVAVRGTINVNTLKAEVLIGH